MSEELLKAKAIAFEALATLYRDDRGKAWDTLCSLGPDYSVPSFASDALSGMEMDAFGTIWRETRDAFSSVRIPFRVHEAGDGFYTYGRYAEDVPLIYTAGKPLEPCPVLVIAGCPMPSLKAKEDTASVVGEAVARGIAVAAPLESGIPSFALTMALKAGGKAVGVLSSWLTRSPSEALLPLMEKLYADGTLLTRFAPSVKSEKWHVVLRNRFLGSFSDAVFLPEEKDGGPSWAIFDQAAAKGKRTMIGWEISRNVNYRWCRDRVEKGALTYRKEGDLAKLFPPAKMPRRRERIDMTPSLFAPGELPD